MDKLIIAKFCGVLCILGAIIVFCLAFADVGLGITQEMLVKSISADGESSDKNTALALMFGLLTIYTITMIFGFAGFFFSGGLGEKIAGKIIFSIVAFVALISILLLLVGGIYMLVVSNDSSGQDLFGLVILAIPFFLFMLLVYSVAAFIIGRAKVLKSLMPVATLVVYLAVPICVLFIFAIVQNKGVSSTGVVGEVIYQLAREATIPHWLSFGAIAWVLMGFAAFLKNKELTSTE